MNQLLGTVFTGIVTDENQKELFVQKNGMTFCLKKNENETYHIGDPVEGFGYINQQQVACLTTEIPKIQIGRYAFGTVVDTRRDLGAFVSIGLPDKDVVVSLDDLPTMHELWPKKGDQLMIALKVDEKNRFWGVLAEESIFRSMTRLGTAAMMNENVSGKVFRLKIIGTYVLTDDFYLAFIHPSERFQEPRLGEQVHGRVIGVRPDGILNISLKPRAYEVISDDAAMILTFLERSENGEIPFSDKSAPEEIQKQFGISKGQFKRALGTLMKQGKIKQETNRTLLLSKDPIDSN